MFLDYVKITVQAGQGGSGCTSFRREKYVPMGGPDGGDGGRGGSILIIVNPQLQTLVDYRYNSLYKAPRGDHGKGSNKHGRKGNDITLEVPPGTVIRDDESGELMMDMTSEGESFVVARGGRGGRGNARYVSSTNQAPRDWEVGRPGEEKQITLELKLIADVGLVGKPNAGKSTMLANVSAARPKIADYPFTTLQPNLGIVRYREYSSFVMADIPGLIAGAHTGKGLGLQFLRHVERTRILLYLIDPLDPEVEDPCETFEVLRNELASHSAMLVKKPTFIVLTKQDVWQDIDWLKKLSPKLPYPCIAISSIARLGLDRMIDQIWQMLESERKKNADLEISTPQ